MQGALLVGSCFATPSTSCCLPGIATSSTAVKARANLLGKCMSSRVLGVVVGNSASSSSTASWRNPTPFELQSRNRRSLHSWINIDKHVLVPRGPRPRPDKERVNLQQLLLHRNISFSSCTSSLSTSTSTRIRHRPLHQHTHLTPPSFSSNTTISKRYLTHYQRLGIDPPSNPQEIKKAYFDKARKCHPDIHGESKTKEFQELSAAYSVLSDPQKKAAYDASGYQDRNYDAPSTGGSYQYGGEQMPDLDAAFAMFRGVFSEFGFQMYYDTLVEDVQNSYDKAIQTQSYEPFWDLAKRRKALVVGVVLPAVVVFRFPWVAMAATRVLGSVGIFLFRVIARNPRMQAAVAAWLWKKIVEFSAAMAGRGDDDSKKNDTRKNVGNDQKSKRPR
ncbi:unnamed protein product [Amoebophrya sp. A25]|nr:unnamed protein product [Amoebophrya sp. A25]|eukprot:GSA25T00014935001.1